MVAEDLADNSLGCDAGRDGEETGWEKRNRREVGGDKVEDERVSRVNPTSKRGWL